ncbi:MAG: hypothetical protein VYA97_02775 [Pseudomonadota bacterium]|nr:hypothetical protein [Pseudomonadota bacterium]
MVFNLNFLALVGGIFLLFLAVAWLGTRRSKGPASKRSSADPERRDRLLSARRREAERLHLRGAIFAITSEETLPGYHLKDLGWVQCDLEDRGAAEHELALAAARKFDTANVLTRLTRATGKQRYQAGTGPKGNPYYKSRSVKIWQALAVEAIPEAQVDRKIRRSRKRHAVVDGSNVAHWGGDNSVSLGPVGAVTKVLSGEGVTPIIVFDANIGYKIGGKYMNAATLRAKLPGRPRVEVVDSGVNADVVIIDLAGQMGADIVSNDLFRDSIAARSVRKRRGFYVTEFGHAELMSARR